MYSDLLVKYGPPGVTNYMYYQVTELMGQGRAAMSFEATNEFGKVMAYPGRLEDTDLSLLPPGPVQKPLVTNWAMAISAYSQKPGPAWFFIQWSTSKEMEERLALEGVAPPRTSVFQGKQFLSWVAERPIRQHWVDALKAMASNGRPGSVPSQIARVPEAADAIGTAVNKVMLGQMSAHDAGCELDAKLVSLLPQ